MSFIQPMFHFRLKPRPPPLRGLVTRGQAVDSSAIISTAGSRQRPWRSAPAGIQWPPGFPGRREYWASTPALAVIIQIQHGGYRVHPQAVDVVLLQPKAGAEEKRKL